MSKKRIKILVLSSFMLMGVMLCKTQDNRNNIQEAVAAEAANVYGTKTVTSDENYQTTVWDFTTNKCSSNVDVGDYLSRNLTNHGITFKSMGETKECRINKSGYLTVKNGGEVYIPVSENTSGILSMVQYSNGSKDRWYSLVVNGVETEKKLHSKPAQGSQSFNYDSTELTIVNNSYYLLLKDNNTGNEMKTSSFTLKEELGARYDVSFVDGTTTLSTQTIKENEFAEAPALTDEVGKVFVGWSDGTSVLSKAAIDAKPVTGPVTYTAVWEDVTVCVVTFIDYEGATSRTITMNAGPLGELDDPAPRENFEFLGWYTTATCEEGTQVAAETELSADITLYGKWQAATYVKIIFDGIAEEYRTFKGRSLDNWPADPVAEGKVFEGWFDAEGKQYTSTSIFNVDTFLTAKWSLELKASYVFDDYGTMPPQGDPDFALVSNDVIEIKTYGYNKQDSITDKEGNDTAITYKDKSYKKYAQAKGLTIKLTSNATVEVICSQTNATYTRKAMVIDKEGRIHNLNQIPVAKKESGAITVNLLAGEYTILTTEGSYNFYGVNVDYTNAETITSGLIGLKSTKLNNQAGYDENNNESMRFVGEIDYTVASEISSIYLSVNSKKLVDNVETDEVEFEGFIYTVYDRVTLTEGAKYGVVDNRLYFYHIVDGLDDTYLTVTCNATINLTDGTVYNLNSVFDYKVSFGK